jgi:hypothetical protein
MSQRKKRKREAAAKAATAAKIATVVKLATPVGKAIRAFALAKAGKKIVQRRRSRRKPAAIAAGVVGAAGVAAAVKHRRGSADQGYGPPNESVPSHETLAPSQAAAGQAPNGGDESAQQEKAEKAGGN